MPSSNGSQTSQDELEASQVELSKSVNPTILNLDDSIATAATAFAAEAATTTPSNAILDDSGVVQTTGALTSKTLSRLPQRPNDQNDVTKIENEKQTETEISVTAALTTQANTAPAVNARDGDVVDVVATGVENNLNTPAQAEAEQSDGTNTTTTIVATATPAQAEAEQSDGTNATTTIAATAATAPASSAASVEGPNTINAQPAPATTTAVPTAAAPLQPFTFASGDASTDRTTLLAQAEAAQQKIVNTAIETATAAIKAQFKIEMEQHNASHRVEIDAMQAAQEQLAETTTQFVAAARDSQNQRDQRDSENEKLIDGLRSDKINMQARLERETIMSASYRAQLDAHPGSSKASSMVSAKSAAPASNTFAALSTELTAQMKAFTNQEELSAERATAAATSEERAKSIQAAADEAQRRKDSEVAAKAAQAKAQQVAFAAAQYEQEKKALAELEHANLVQEQRKLALAQLEKEQQAAEAHLESVYRAKQAELAEAARRKREAFGIATTGMPAGYSATAASTTSTSSTGAGASVPGYSSAFAVGSAPAPIAPAGFARTSTKQIVKLPAWADAEKRLGFPGYLESVLQFTRKSHAFAERDSETWIDAYNLPDKVEPFVRNTLIEKLHNVEWAMILLKTVAKKLGCSALEHIPLKTMLKTLQDACMNTTIGLLNSELIGVKVLLTLSLTNVKATPSDHIETIDLLFQKKVQANDAIMKELARSTNPEHARAVKEYEVKLDWRAIGRNLAKEFLRIVELQHCAEEFTTVASKCASAEDIGDLLELAAEKANSFHTPAKPEPSSRPLDSDNTDAAHAATEKPADWTKVERKAAKKLKKSTTATSDIKERVDTLWNSTDEWDLQQRALVISHKGEKNTFTRNAGRRCVSCNKLNSCKPNQCVIGTSFERWKAKTGSSRHGSTGSSRNQPPRKDSKRDYKQVHKDAHGRAICFDHSQGECDRGSNCRYSHEPAAKSSSGGSSYDSELDRLRKENAQVTQSAKDLAQLLCVQDPTFAKSAQEAVGENLKKSAMAFILSQNTADDR